MQNSKVIHLVSNSFTHTENIASSFKVSYNVPFDLTGKKVARTDIGLTKSSSNVLNETITIKSHIPPTKKYNTAVSNNATLIASEEINTWENFFQVLRTTIKDIDQGWPTCGPFVLMLRPSTLALSYTSVRPFLWYCSALFPPPWLCAS